MTKTIKKIGAKIEEIRESDDNTKKKWFIGASATTMVVVIFLWAAYLSASLPAINPVEQHAENNSRFFESVASQTANVFQGVRRGFLEIIDNVKSPREIKIEL